jgi:TRAP-type C4-dicarboxylate transport system permease small subunit
MLGNLIKKVNQLADFLNALLLGIITAGVLFAVFGRYVFRIPLPGVVEAAYFAMLCCMFLQTGKALYEGKHASTSLVTDRVSGKTAAALGIASNAIVLICGAVFVWYCARFTLDSYARNWHHSGGFQVPMYLLYGVMSLGSLYMALVALLKFIEHVRKIERVNHGS